MVVLTALTVVTAVPLVTMAARENDTGEILFEFWYKLLVFPRATLLMTSNKTDPLFIELDLTARCNNLFIN